MEGQLVDIEYDCGLVDICKIVEDIQGYYIVCRLLQTDDLRFRFSRFSHQVLKESVSGFYDTTDLEETGLYRKIDDVYYEAVSSVDSDYEYDSEDATDTDSDVSLYSEYSSDD